MSISFFLGNKLHEEIVAAMDKIKVHGIDLDEVGRITVKEAHDVVERITAAIKKAEADGLAEEIAHAFNKLRSEIADRLVFIVPQSEIVEKVEEAAHKVETVVENIEATVESTFKKK